MNVRAALESRRSCRSFLDRSLPSGLLDALVDRARRTPSAGNTQGVGFLVLEGSEQTAAYWGTTLPERDREAFPWPGLLLAPALVVVYTDAGRYLERYSEPDKASTGLGGSDGDWPIPYWFVDAAFSAMALQLLAVDEGLWHVDDDRGLGREGRDHFGHGLQVVVFRGKPRAAVALGMGDRAGVPKFSPRRERG